jgi:hypothetical protein
MTFCCWVAWLETRAALLGRETLTILDRYQADKVKALEAAGANLRVAHLGEMDFDSDRKGRMVGDGAQQIVSQDRALTLHRNRKG